MSRPSPADVFRVAREQHITITQAKRIAAASHRIAEAVNRKKESA
jgi:hypothetical protein